MRRHQPLTGLGVLALCGSVLGLWSPTSAAASCAAPPLWIGPAGTAEPSGDEAPPPVSRSRSVSVSGEWFQDGCNDTGTSSGCSGPSPAPVLPPMRDVALKLTQGRSAWTLGTADAAGPDRNYAISWVVHLPADVEPGPAVLSVSSSSSDLEVEIAD